MSKMYQQFEQNRADNISDPSEQLQRPISTISGISHGEDRRPPRRSSVKISEVSDSEADAITAANGRKEEASKVVENVEEQSQSKEGEVDGSVKSEKKEARKEDENDTGDERGDGVNEKADEKERSVKSEEKMNEAEVHEEDKVQKQFNVGHTGSEESKLAEAAGGVVLSNG